MRIALINDTHFGCRNDNPNYEEYIYRFWDEQFFPYKEVSLPWHNYRSFVRGKETLAIKSFLLMFNNIISLCKLSP